jgi:small GTP-binding protein
MSEIAELFFQVKICFSENEVVTDAGVINFLIKETKVPFLRLDRIPIAGAPLNAPRQLYADSDELYRQISDRKSSRGIQSRLFAR